MTVSRDEVVWAYRMILGREPESEGVITDKLHFPNSKRLRAAFLSSKEFKSISLNSQDDSTHPPNIITLRPKNNITSLTSASEMDALWVHVQASWEQLGSEMPHHSVLTSPDYLPGEFEENEKEFWRTGKDDILIIKDICESANLQLSRFRTCLEYGCGVGRVSVELASEFPQVLAVDISRPHLDLAQRRAKEVGASNIGFIQASPDRISTLPVFDFFYSRIVLQHNPPPIIAFILKNVLNRLSTGGLAIFQVPTYMRGYSFELNSYLSNVERGMEMHCLPQSEIFRLVREAGAHVLEVRENGDIGNYGLWVSNIFTVAK